MNLEATKGEIMHGQFSKVASLAAGIIFATMQLTGCAGTAGRDFDTAHAHDVKEGQPKAQVSSWFGDPEQTVTMSATPKGCVERWIYKYARSINNSTKARALIVDFDGKGAVCDTVYSEINK